MSDDTTKDEAESAAMAASLRQLATMIEDNPDLFPVFRYAFSAVNVFPGDKLGMAKVVRLALAHGAKVEKSVEGKFFVAKLRFGDRVVVEANAQREEVCERVVVGTEQVTKKVPDPELLAKVPEIEVTETVEQVQWKCHPLLDSDAGGAS